MEVLELINFYCKPYVSNRASFECTNLDYSDFSKTGGRRIYDLEVVRFALKHMRFFDKFSPRKIGQATLVAHEMLSGDLDSNDGNWYFKFNWHYKEDET